MYYDYVVDSTRREFLPVYSTKSFQAVDTFDGAFRDFLFTPDGKYMVAKEASHARILLFDMATRSAIASDTGVTPVLLSLSADGRYLLAGKENAFELTVYSVEGLTRLWQDTVPRRLAEFIGRGDRIVYSEWGNDTFYVVDFINAPDTRVKVNGGTGFYPHTMALDTASDKLYVTGETITGLTHLRIYDGDDLTSLRYIRIPENFKSARLAFAANGSYVYLAAPFAGADSPPGVLRYDVSNESLEWFIDATRFLAPVLAPQDIQLTPDGAILCILSLPDVWSGLGYLFMFSTKTGELLKVIYPEGAQGLHIRMFPLRQ
ncbi:hypothetical protein C3F09_12960 [candidate division GN15 bacterium]|uniref:YncE family protein n=1 Tax=candidate division GN15 bacterium TaxID=2072418 RepID=A0A855WT62_9BACT|nr:MAG: hypothetical protein C3F09_12960 [candidate division GN15 bacterium]